MTTTALLTPDRRWALDVMARTYPQPARISKTTLHVPDRFALVDASEADWLVETGLADHGLGPTMLSLTAAGLAACRAAGIAVAS